MAINGEISAGKVYIGPEIPVRLDQSQFTLDDENPFSGTLACVGPAFFGAPTNIGFARAVVNIGPALTPFTPGVPTLALDVTGGTHHQGYMNNFALSNFLGASNTIGLLNKLGLNNTIGMHNRVGYGVEVGGNTTAEPDICMSSSDFRLASEAGGLYGFWTYNGSEICAPCPSDVSAKINITELKNSLDKVLALRGVSFEWNPEVVPQRAEKQKVSVGLIAQEVEKVIPEAVITEKIEGSDLKTVEYGNLVGVLIGAIQEQQSQIEDLKKRLDELEKQ